MANPERGEVALVVDGRACVMRLTLGALAELEGVLSAGSMVALAEKFEGGEISAGELIALLGAGLRGGGIEISDAELAAARIEGGAVTAMRAGMALLEATFR